MSSKRCVWLGLVGCLAGAFAVALACARLRADEKPAGGEEVILPADLSVVPPRAVAFVRVRVADVLNGPAGEKALPALRKEVPEALPVLEDALGVPLEQVDRITLVVLPPPDPPRPGPLLMAVSTRTPYDREKVVKALAPHARETKVAGQTLHITPRGDTAVQLLTDRAFLSGEPKALAALVKRSDLDGKGALATALAVANGKHHVVIGVQPGLLVVDRPAGGKGRLADLPTELLPYKPLLLARSAVLTCDLKAEIRLHLRLTFEEEDQAVEGETSLRTGMYVVRELLARELADAGFPPRSSLAGRVALEALKRPLKEARVERRKEVVQASADVEVDPDVIARPSALVAEIGTQVLRHGVSNKLKELALAMHNSAGELGRIPGPAIYDRAGRPLLSWRVALLPFLGEEKLYREFKLDEPWDSPHNKKLLKRMPRVFAPVGVKAAPDSTLFRVFTGEHTPFDPRKASRGPPSLGARLIDFTDGTSNTILIVEAHEAVPWTKPEELPYDPKKPLPRLGATFPNGFMVALADGSTRFLSKKVSEETLRAAITPQGGEVLGADW